MKGKLVFICSPYRSDNPDPLGRVNEVRGNIRMAQTGCRMAVERGFIPIAPHLYFPQFLSEETEREEGIRMGIGMLGLCDELWVLGRRVSGGMAREISHAKKLGLPVRIMEHPETGADRLMRAVKE